MKPTRKQFEDYIRIRDSGVTNMFALDIVCALSVTGLTKEHCFYIMKHFDELLKEYNIKGE